MDSYNEENWFNEWMDEILRSEAKKDEDEHESNKPTQSRPVSLGSRMSPILESAIAAGFRNGLIKPHYIRG